MTKKENKKEKEKMNKNKKAQMKIQQMSFMIIAVFLFLSMVGMVVVTVKLSELRNSATELEEQNAKLLASKIASSPEFSCEEVYGNARTDCIDLDKVMALKSNIRKYEDFWGVSNIEIRIEYPPTIPYKQIECIPLVSYPKYPNGTVCNYIKLINKPNAKGLDKSNFVAVCRKEVYRKKVDAVYVEEIVDKCEMGKIIIRYETK